MHLHTSTHKIRYNTNAMKSVTTGVIRGLCNRRVSHSQEALQLQMAQPSNWTTGRCFHMGIFHDLCLPNIFNVLDTE